MKLKTKICDKCIEELPANTKYFYKDRSTKDQLSKLCKKCYKESIIGNEENITKVCTACGEKLPLTHFYKSNTGKDGFTSKCKKCIYKTYEKVYRENSKIRNKKNENRSLEELNSQTKICSKCGKELPATAEYFNRSKVHKDGIRSYCKECQKQYYRINKDKMVEYHKQYHEKNREEIAERHRKYYAENRDKILEYKKQHNMEKKDKISEYHKQYYKENRDKISEYVKKNKDKIAETRKQYYEEHKEKILEQQKQYYLENRSKISERHKKYYDEHKSV